MMILNINVHHNADGNAVARTSVLLSGQMTIHIAIRKLDCEGTEKSVSQCSHDSSYQCRRPGSGVLCPAGQLNGK